VVDGCHDAGDMHDRPHGLRARAVERVATGDPDGTFWRRGLRLAVVLPPLLAVGVAIDAIVATGYAVFALVGAIGLADFGGSRAHRLKGYIGLTLVGVVFVAIGTWCSNSLAAAIVGMFVVGFVTRMVGVFGGNASVGNAAALLAFVLAVMTPAAPGDLAAREAGWLAGGLVAIVAAFVVWPRPHHDDLGRAAAGACRAIAAAVRTSMHASAGPDGRTDGERDVASVRALRVQLAQTPGHPGGPGRRDQLLLQTVELAERAAPLLRDPWPPATVAADADLAEATASSFERYADALSLGRADLATAATVGIDGIDQARQGHRRAVEAWLKAELDEDAGRLDVVEVVRASFPLRVLSAIAEQLWLTAVWASGSSDPRADEGTELGGGGLGVGPERLGWWRRARNILWSHLDTGSAWFRSSLRAAVALSASVAVGHLLGFEHSFWIVLGTLSVLRSNASSTSASAAQAVLGTVIGFALVTLVIVGPGSWEPSLWVLLPVVSFLGMWGAGVFGLVAGQAGFAMIVVVLFNILDPAGWETGLLRVETVAIGVTVSVAASLLFWPRGARAVLRRDVALAYVAAARYLDAVAGRIGRRAAGDEVDLGTARAAAVRAQRRAMEAFEEYLAEHGARPEQWASWGPLLRGGTAVTFSTHLIARRLREDEEGPDQASATVASCLTECGEALVADLDAVATGLEARRPVAEGARPTPPGPADADVLACLSRSVDDPATFDRALALVWIDEWLAYVQRAVERVDAAVAEVSDHGAPVAPSAPGAGG
jgi:uncharacterized membrane protein YccC